MMRYLTFGAERPSYKIALLVNDIHKDELKKHYLTPYALKEEDVIVIDLHQTPGKKATPAAEQKRYITEELAPTLTDLSVEFLIVADGDYFKTFTKKSKVDKAIGYVLPTEFGPWQVVYVPNWRTVFYDPTKVTQRIDIGITALQNWMAGTYRDPGNDIIKFADYPETVEEISDWLDKLLEMDCDLTCDIEGFSLKHYDAGIGTISFAWNEHKGIAFAIDILDDPVHSMLCRQLLLNFFEKFKRTMTYHRIWYDVNVLIYQLFMDNLLDNQGLLRGLEVMLRNWDCTQLISYLATNSCAGNKLGLKDLAQEHAGDYAQDDIKDIRKIPLPQLLQYNLVDTLATWFVKKKNYPKMVADQQLEIYETLFKPAIVDIIQMQLTGMPMDMDQVKRVNTALEGVRDDAMTRIQNSPIVQSFTVTLANKWATKRNSELKVKRVTPLDFKEKFNPNSDPQMQELLYEVLGLPILDLTDSKQPATGGKTLKKLINHTKDPAVIELIEAINDFTAVGTILTSFMPKFLNAKLGPDGWYWLFGFFNLGGTVSGRLSSSKPNLQNIPANVEMVVSAVMMKLFGDILGPFIKDGKLSLGKLIKSCFKAPPGWHFCGIDFASLEDRISALTTKDPNKLKVYSGHIVYVVDIDGVAHHIRDDTTVVYEGVTYSGEELYRKLATNCEV